MTDFVTHDHKRGVEMKQCSHSKISLGRGRNIKVWRFSFLLFASCLYKPSFVEQSFLLFFSFVSFLLSLFLRSARIWWAKRANFQYLTRWRDRRKKTKQHRFVYTVAIADERTNAARSKNVFFSFSFRSFPNDQFGRHWTNNRRPLFSIFRPVRFLAIIHTFIRTNTCISYSNLQTILKNQYLPSMITTHTGKEKDPWRIFLSLWVTHSRF